LINHILGWSFFWSRGVKEETL